MVDHNTLPNINIPTQATMGESTLLLYNVLTIHQDISPLIISQAHTADLNRPMRCQNAKSVVMIINTSMRKSDEYRENHDCKALVIKSMLLGRAAPLIAIFLPARTLPGLNGSELVDP